jgi:hypothetical protein
MKITLTSGARTATLIGALCVGSVACATIGVPAAVQSLSNAQILNAYSDAASAVLNGNGESYDKLGLARERVPVKVDEEAFAFRIMQAADITGVTISANEVTRDQVTTDLVIGPIVFATVSAKLDVEGDAEELSSFITELSSGKELTTVENISVTVNEPGTLTVTTYSVAPPATELTRGIQQAGAVNERQTSEKMNGDIS